MFFLALIPTICLMAEHIDPAKLAVNHRDANRRPYPGGASRLFITITAFFVPFIFACARSAQAAGVVSQCDEPHFKQAASGGGTVTFTCSGTITVLGGTVDISLPTTIDGSGHKVTISGGGAVRVFYVVGSVLTLNNLTVANGNANNPASSGSYLDGGGVFVAKEGFLTVMNCTFSGNQAQNSGGAISFNSFSSLTITNSTFSGNYSFGHGGAIYGSGGSLIVNSSTFSGNMSYVQGGAIYNLSRAHVVASTFYDNRALTGGGAIENKWDLSLVN